MNENEFEKENVTTPDATPDATSTPEMAGNAYYSAPKNTQATAPEQSTPVQNTYSAPSSSVNTQQPQIPTQNPVQNGNAQPAAQDSSAATSGNPYSYQNSYYRNVTPHQDEPVRPTSSASYTAQNTGRPAGGYNTTANGGNGGQVPPTNNGYSYANYYNNSSNGNNGNTNAGGVPPMNNIPPMNPVPTGDKPKSKAWVKIVAVVAAVVVVAGGSYGVWRGVQSYKNHIETSSSAEMNAPKDDKGDNEQATVADSQEDNSSDTSTDKSDGKSWIELASGEDSMSVADIVKKVTPSVVGVTATFEATTTNNSYDSYDYFFGYGGFGNGDSGNSTQQATGVGTGIIMSDDGYIVTNAHVIYDDEYGYGEAKSVSVQMYDETTTYDASIVAYDTEADIAVLKVDTDDELTAAEFGDSSQLEVGEMVVAIGNPLGLELQNTVTCGIVSALNRQVTINDKTMTLIQTDTAINSGNSGGPLINSAGQVIGINSAKMSSSYSSDSASIEGIGFAIPMSEAKGIVDDLINYGYVTGRPQLGISCQDVSEAVSQAYNIPVGAYVISVTEGGAAEKAGLQTGDVITAIQGTEITTTEELNDVKNQYEAGDTVTLTITRSGQSMEIKVVLEEVTSNK